MTRRTDRVNGLLREEISQMVAVELRDPRLSSIVSITHVETAADLRRAKVFVSVLGSKQEKKLTLEALESAAGFLNKELRHKIHLRHIPEFIFVLDESIEKSEHIYRLIKQGIPEGDN